MYLQINIGRNVTGVGPMSDSEWLRFRNSARSILSSAFYDLSLNFAASAGNLIEEHTSQSGSWDDQAEESAHISIVAPVRHGRGNALSIEAVLEVFRSQTRHLAYVFKQESIAIIISSELVSPYN